MTMKSVNSGRFQIVIAGLFHETHTFLDGLTKWESFEVREADAIFQAKGDASPLGGVLEFADQHDWEVIPAIMATAVPSATVHNDVFERYWQRWMELVREPIASGVDAIFLVLHGAFVSESYGCGG